MGLFLGFAAGTSAQYQGWLIPEGGKNETSPLKPGGDWNGHAIQLRVQVDDMPAFKDKLTREEVWALVEYLKVLRTPLMK